MAARLAAIGLTLAMAACHSTDRGSATADCIKADPQPPPPAQAPQCPSCPTEPKPVASEHPPVASNAPSPAPDPSAPLDPSTLVVTIPRDGRCLVGASVLGSCDDITSFATGIVRKNPDVRVMIRADAAVTHGKVMHVLDLLKQAGVTKIAFGVAPP